MHSIKEIIKKNINQNIVFYDEDMKMYSTMKTGGKADIIIKPTTYSEVVNTLNTLENYSIEYIVLGQCSNILVSDKGIRQVVVILGDNFSTFEIDDNVMVAYSGISLTKLSTAAQNSSLTGFEFAHGIPGTIGGAVVMNAGAYGSEMKDVISSVDLYIKGTVKNYTLEELKLGYRTSIIKELDATVLKVYIKLNKGTKKQIINNIKELTEKRVNKQPLNLPSVGSVFKRPEGHYAGKLIEDAGLKGCKIGGVKVSEKHCGFIVNDNIGTSEDVDKLIKHIQKTVKEKFDVQLSCEVKYIGEW